MLDRNLDWLDELPDMRVCGVPGVPVFQPQETATFAGTPALSAGVPGVPRNTPEHLDTPPRVPPKPAENRHGTPGTPGTPQIDKGWSKLAQKPDPIGGWAILIAQRAAGSDPKSIAPDRWQQVLDDAAAFLETWGEQAVALGWIDRDLFAVPPGPERWMRAGLVALLRGRPVVAITADAITIAVQGGLSRYRRSPNMGAVMLWDPRAYSEQRRD